MPKLNNHVETWFEDLAELPYQAVPHPSSDEVRIFQSHINDGEQAWDFRVLTHETDGTIQVYSMFPVHIPQVRRDDVIQYLMRLNYVLIAGSWELDARDGEVRFKTSLHTGDDEVPFDLIEALLLINVQSYRKHATDIMNVSFGGASPNIEYEEIMKGGERTSHIDDTGALPEIAPDDHGVIPFPGSQGSTL